MSSKPNFDVQAAHKHFAASCFNAAWDLIDRSERTPEEVDEMIRLALASLWHWTQVADHTATNLSIGYWQVSRVYALAGQPELARRAAETSLEYGKDSGPFFVAYAYEALARAEQVVGNRVKAVEFLAQARAFAGQVKESEDQDMVNADLKVIEDQL